MSECNGSSSSNSSNSSGAQAAAAAAEAEVHGEPSGDCLVCYEDITKENYCEYRKKGDTTWHPSFFCYPCVQQLQQTQFKRYCDCIAKSTCAKEQGALLRRGPPINVYDKHAFPLCGEDEAHTLWTYFDRTEKTAKLHGSLTGEAREKLWAELKGFLIEGEKVEDKE